MLVTLLKVSIRRIFEAGSKIIYVAKVWLTFNTQSYFKLKPKDRLPRLPNCLCVYPNFSFVRAQYVHGTRRHLSDWVQQHCPMWLYRKSNKTVTGATLVQAIDENHAPTLDESFSIASGAPFNRRESSIQRSYHYRTTHIYRVLLKQFINTLMLLWLKITKILWQTDMIS